MRKAAGFLLVLLLATLVGVTTSYGTVPGDTDSSHLVHLTYTHGPQLGVSCDVCHGTETPPTLDGPSNLTNTTVCDTCHSPDGAYDGVDDANIGARNNWDNSAPPGLLIFNGSGGFQTGKDKWCVGCHDGVPSLINSVSAPNIAGEFNSDCSAAGVPYSCCTGVGEGCVDYGYYHTGHGKYVSESITCLACHDPDSEHVVDGVARTYSAAADNYQAGYRLKLVGGQAPLVIPRPLTAVTADQFRQCFSCHNSSPFMDSLNTNTNFRADVDDFCVPLVSPVNNHYEHLIITDDRYDSDWDGVSIADSPPSCPACHNVHGPRLRVGAVDNAPGMIRTGELIGRYIEGALDLDYYINPCPDDPTLTLSPTNQTVGSTGGMMFEYSPTGTGSIARNGVCDMCHNEAEPYWRAAKKLPANDFSLDGNTKALWSVDNGALTADSIGTNTLTDNNTVGTSTGDMQGGDASADFERNNSEYLSITDASLDSGFPLKSDDDGTFSITLWYKPESLNGSKTLISKYDISQSTKSFFIYTTGTTLAAYIGHTNGTSFELLDNSLTLSTGVWYHIGLTFNNSDKTWKLRVYDDSEAGNPLGEGTGVVLNASGTATNNLSVTTAAFQIGALLNNGSPTYYLDGLIDEVVVFGDILTTGEIDEIRQGTYAVVHTPTTTTTLPLTTTTTLPPTTTTTLPPTTTTTLPPGPTTTTTTLPPGPGNDFSLDGNTKALWRVDNGALTTDFKGTNTLTDNNSVGTSTGDMQEGDASADFERNNSEYLSITNASLDSGFPLKSDDDGTFSITFWYKPETLSGSKTLISKYDISQSTKSFFIYTTGTTLAAYIGHTNGTSFELLDNSLTLSTGVWYHIGLTFNNSDKTWKLRVYDDSEAGNPLGEGIGVVLNASGTATNNLSVTTAAFQIGALLNNGSPTYYLDGLIDEVVVFDDILTTGEIDQIRQGTYAHVSSSTTTTLPPATTTTTLPGGTTTTTLPPAQNDFSLDGNAVARWSVDNGALTTDFKGTNTLTDNNTVGTSTGDMQEGDASADFEKNNFEYLSITDAILDSGFPLKSDDDGTFSITLWYKPETLSGSQTLISKYDLSQSTKSFFIYTTGTTLAAYIGHTNGTSFELLDNSLTLSTGVWYHIGLAFNNSDKTWKLRVYDDSEAGNPLGEGIGVVLNASGTATNYLSVTTAAFQIGAMLNNGSPKYYLDGLIDEVVVFGDILTTGEIDEIRQGTYAVVYTPTTTTTLIPPTTTTTLPPGPGNDFSLDGNTKALWCVDNGALTTDSKGTNTLTDNNTVGTSMGDMQEGDASADFEKNNYESLTLADASLDSGFPLKSDDDGTFSITLWYKPETLSGSKTLISKYDISQSTKSFFIYTTGTTLAAYIGHTNGTSFELLDNSLTLSTGVWYHIGLTFNNSDKTWKLRVYDDSEAGNPLGEGIGVVLNASGTATNNLSVTTAAFQIGALLNNGSPTYYLDGLIDEVVVFDDILTTGEIDEIRQGYYAHVSSSTTTTLPPATTTTTTLPGGTTTTTTLPGGTTTTTTLPGGTTTTTTLPGGTTTTTLPPAQNDFSGEDNLEALWCVDNGPLTMDSSGMGNTLTDNNTVGTDTVDYKEGDASAHFEKNNYEYLSITDASLVSGFPLKSDDDGTFSITLWYKPETLSGSKTLVSKYDLNESTKSFFIYSAGTTLAAYIGHTNGTSYELLDNSLTLSTGVWYHIGLTFNNTTKAWQFRVYNDSEAGNPLGEGTGVVLNASGTATNYLSVTTAAFQIGALLNSGSPAYYQDGLIDEVVVFDDILTTGEIDEIRQGTYEDLCPGDPNKSEPGVCGCGYTEWGVEPYDCIENDSSHSAHITEASGPQITCGTSCHAGSGMTTGGDFLDANNLTNTTVCDTCHSPLGAYNGVDSTSGSVGAKDNWVSGVYDTVSGGLLLGKEKWCVGCHDDVGPSVINGVSAPSVAGDDIDYGYYKTGHGKHGNEKITCLACHDPALMHVDSVARTYSAAADNYQAGYRLKRVDGGLPLDVPRTGPGLTVEQFRLCFSCHDSAPYMDSANTDTNFRADVDDNGVVLVPQANRHAYHLFTTQVWDSDWDGVPSDSAPSCPACHNVHGPRLRDAGVNNAPAMIRTGELIGRVSEGALNLDYFIHPARNMTLSSTNELSGSTGGVFMDDPLQLVNPQLRGGVCGMCHATNEPYWREANISIFSCDKCHIHDPHNVAIDINNDHSYNPGQPCSDCHDGNNADLNDTPLDSWTDIESEHNVSTNGDGSCLTCHQSPRQEVIDAIALAANPTNCLNCHSDKYLTTHTYDHATDPAGGLDYAPITADAACTTCHSGADVVKDVHGGTCTTCHTTFPDLKNNNPRLNFNAGISTSYCTTCHLDTNNNGFTVNFHGISWSHLETTTRHNNLWDSDSSSPSGYDCQACHIDMADAQAKLTKHMDHDGAGAGNNIAANCNRCHFPSTWGGLNDEPAQTVIAAGIAGSQQTCEDCHTAKGVYLLHGLSDDGGADDVSAAHDNFMAESGAATSTCSNCHTTVTEQNRINLHTTNATPPGNCLTCHQNTTDMGGGTTPQSVIDAGKGPGGGSQNCDTCHISINTSWGNHTTVDHTTFVLEDTNCTECHDGDPGTNFTAPNSVTTPYAGTGENHAPRGCFTCHDNSHPATRGNYMTHAQANQFGYVGAMPAGSLSPTCSDCHTAYFDGHFAHTATTHTVSYDNGVNDVVLGGTGCVACHNPISNWNDIFTLHDHKAGNCATCHDYTEAAGQYGNTPEGTVASVIMLSNATTCADCHTDKANQAHGGHPFPFGSDATCTTCHEISNGVLNGVHGNGTIATCSLCHNGATDATTEKLGDSIPGKSPVGDARYADGTAGGGSAVWAAVTCLTCHPTSQLDSQGVAMNNHLTTIAGVASAHNLSSNLQGGSGYDCESCHSTDVANEQLNTHMPADTVANCAAICHSNTTASATSGAVAKTVIDTATTGEPNSAVNCEQCHVAKGDYRRHGLTDNTGPDGVATEHNNLDVSTSVAVDETNCAQCHDLTSETTRLQIHTQPLSGNPNTCLTCHTAVGAAVTAIDNGKTSADPGPPAAQKCEACHAAKGDYSRHGLADDDTGGDTVVDVHEQFGIETIGASSTCSSASCHNTTDVNDIATMQLHTRGTTPTTCLTCHQYGAPTSTVIAAGWGSADPARCDDCHTSHGSDWYSHTVDHTASGMNAVLPEPAGASRTVSCSSTNCHAADGDIITGVHDVYVSANPCAECHNSSGTLIDGNDGYGDATLGSGGGATCSTCHVGAGGMTLGFDNHSHVHDTTVTYDSVTDRSQSSNTPCHQCHGVGAGAPYSLANWSDKLYEHDFVDASQDGAGACTSCHDYDTRGNQTGVSVPPTPVIATVTDAIDNNTTVKCLDCHTVKVQPNGHGAINHKTYLAGAVKGLGTNCMVCHSGATDPSLLDDDSFYIDTLHNQDPRGCGTCHRAIAGAGDLVSYASPNSNAAGNNTPDPLPSLIQSATSEIDYQTDSPTGGFCADCHAPYGVGVGNHANSMDHNNQLLTTQTECDACHAAANGEAVRTTIHSSLSCTNCHDSSAWNGTTGGYIMLAGTSAANHTYGTQENCMGCHNTYDTEFTGTSNHSTDTHDGVNLTASATCATADCHTGSIKTVVHTTCQSCHVSTTDGSFADGTDGSSPFGLTVLGSATGHVKGSPSSCTSCHGEASRDYSLDFTVHDTPTMNTNHENNVIATDAKCTDCHGTTNVISAALLHNNNCLACHSNTGADGTLTGSAVAFDGTNPISCAGCHTLLNADFGNAAHTVTRGDSHGTALGGDAICTSCHTGDIRVNVHGNGVSSTCTLCHISTTDGRFADGTAIGSTLDDFVVGTAVGHYAKIGGGTSTCIDCHSGYDTDFDGSHQQETHSELTGVVGNCDTCHGTDIIGTIHNVLPNGCETCHTDVTAAGGENGTFVALSSAENHTVGSPSSCIGCHTDFVGVNGFKTGHASVDTHADVLRNVNSATRSLDCDNCHLETAANIHTVTHDMNLVGGDFACLRCHQSMDDNGKLIAGGNGWGDASGHTVGQPSNCADCHGASYFSFHQSYTHTGVSYNATVDQSELPLQGCGTATCHDDAGTSLADWAAIKLEHGTGTTNCVKCHDKGASGNADETATLAAIDNGAGTTETCATCHLDKLDGGINQEHKDGGHPDAAFTANALCTDCHNGGVGVVNTIHGGCALCHIDATGGGTLQGSAVGQTAGGQPWDCTVCHSAISDQATKVAFHHATDQAVLGHCESCHSINEVDTGTAPRQPACAICHVNDTGTELQIVSYDLTLADGSEPVDIQTGAVTSPANHTITYGSGPATEIYDFRACFECHSGNNANYPTALPVKPFHGYPGNWTVGHLAAGAGQLPGLGQTAPPAYSTGLNDLADADEVPYFYQWWHPGPGIARGTGIRRFNSIMAYRMGGNNQDLYKGYSAITLTGTNPNLNLEAAGKDQNYSFQLGNGESVTGGLQTHASSGDTYSTLNRSYSQTFTIPYSGTGVNSWSDGSGPYTEVPSYPDITGGDALNVVKADWNGTDLTVYVTNSLNNGSTISLTYTGDALCNGNMTWSPTNLRHELTCTTASFIAGTDQVTVSSSATNSIDVTVYVNDNQGGGPVGNTLILGGTTYGNWVTNGSADPNNGKLIVYAEVSDAQNTPQYAVDYTTISSSNLTWHIGGSYWHDNGAYTGVAFDGNAGALRIYDPGAVGDDKTFTVTDISDAITVTSADFNADYLTVTAVDAGNDPYADCQGGYKAVYNGLPYDMVWNGGANEFQLVNQLVTGGYNGTAAKNDGTVQVHCASFGGDDVTFNGVTDSTPVGDDTLTVDTADWLNNGDGATLGTLDISATTSDDGNTNNCIYLVDYAEAVDVQMTHAGGTTFTATIPNVTFQGTAASITIDSVTPQCDPSATNGSADVDNSDIVTVSTGQGVTDYNDSTKVLNVVATEFGDNPSAACLPNGYYATYGGQEYGPMTWTGTQLQLLGADATASGGIFASVTVHCAQAGGDSASGAVFDATPSGGGKTIHDASGNNTVLFGSTADETCANCHSGETVYDVHGAECGLCHDTANMPGIFTVTPLQDFDNTLTDDPRPIVMKSVPAGGGTCTTCHESFVNDMGRLKTWEHHTGEHAQAGNCVHCHTDVREPGKCNLFPEQAPCAYCHTDFEEMKGTGRGDYVLKVFDFATTGFNSPIASTTSSTHTIPNLSESTTTPIDIHDFGACASCHDNTDMFDGHPVVTGATAPAPQKLYPYHAAGMAEDYTRVPLLPGAAGDPGNTQPEGYPYIPLDNTFTATGMPPGMYDEAAVDVGGSDDSLPIFNDDQAAPYRDDLFFAYHFHPGRGGITDTSTVIQNGGQDVGSFNILYNFMSPAAAGGNPQYYKKNKSVNGAGGCTSPNGQDKKYYLAGQECETAYVNTNFSTPNSLYTDPYNNDWDFSNWVNVPYVDWVTPKPADAYWVTVPQFAKKTPQTVPDKVYITDIDCTATPNVQVYSQLTEDYHAGLSDGNNGFAANCPGDLCAKGKVQVSINGGAMTAMTWNGTSHRWEYNDGCSTGQTIDAQSTFNSSIYSATQQIAP